MLALALGFSFAAEATNNTFTLTDSGKAAIERQQEDSATKLQQELLGQYADINALTATNLRQAYITLLENVRSKHATWTDQDWAKAQAVVNKLDAKKNTLEKQLGVDDKGKIKLLQGELRTLETKADAKD